MRVWAAMRARAFVIFRVACVVGVAAARAYMRERVIGRRPWQ